MLKLYKFTGDTKMYWETWEEEDGGHVLHWGRLGTKGETRQVKRPLFGSVEHKLQREIEQAMANGYAEIPGDEHAVLLIEYRVDGMGTVSDLEKRVRLEDRMNDALGWTGLGHCDGGSMGSGTMEVFCIVVDFDLAKSSIEENLGGSEFSDYSRICRQGDST